MAAGLPLECPEFTTVMPNSPKQAVFGGDLFFQHLKPPAADAMIMWSINDSKKIDINARGQVRRVFSKSQTMPERT